ncbi:MAG: helix-turn-helix domain-containing protein [Paludibacter sp.]|jgi:transcriptional regulator with XRE-family HTH domain|nr:helix-turn-helix domain-containing protein [Paludibacter sp.]
MKMKLKLKSQEVRRLRRDNGFSQVYIAEKLGLSQSQYSHIESGNGVIEVEKVEIISKLLNVNFLDILEREEGHLFIYCNQSGNINRINNKSDFQQEREAYILQIDDLKKDKELLREQIALLKDLFGKK